MITSYIMLIMEIIGTVSFAASGALVAISCSLDLFGVIIVGCVTAVGGGITRDLLIGNVPPQVFSNPFILLLSFVTALVVFLVAMLNEKKFAGVRDRIERINVFFDALGLGAFSVAGIEGARTAGYADNFVLVVTLGVITGVGGGVLRDVFVNEKPYILTRHIYAVASILGCIIYYLLGVYWNHQIIATIVAVLFVVILRLLAAHYRWKLPKVKLSDGVK